VIVGVIATAVSVYYYLAVVRALYMRSDLELRAAAAGGSPPRDTLLQASVAVCLAVTVATFVFVDPVLDYVRDAASQLPF
jgi:NADH:ubiquinone oxidoreductase subunit 2 (subunit N)